MTQTSAGGDGGTNDANPLAALEHAAPGNHARDGTRFVVRTAPQALHGR